MKKQYLKLSAICFFLLLAFAGKAQVTATFTYSPNTGLCTPPPQLIVFSATQIQSGTTYTYQWTFPGGSPGTSAATTAAVSFTTCGTYAVKLKVTNTSTSQVDSTTQNVTVNCKPHACVTVTGGIGCVPLCPTLNFSCSTAGTGTLANYDIDYGDGSVYYAQPWNTQPPCHTYNTPNTIFTVVVIVHNSVGCQYDTTFTVQTISAPGFTICTSNSASSCSFPYTTNFTTCPAPPTGVGPFTYVWTFSGTATPNITTSTLAAPSVTWANAGFGTASCVITGAGGCSTTVTATNIVTISNVSSTLSAPTLTMCNSGTITITASNNPSSTTWTIAPAAGAILFNGTSNSITVLSGAVGSWTICGTATFPGGCTVNFNPCITVSATALPPACFTINPVNPTSCSPPLFVTVTPCATGPGVSQSWSFFPATVVAPGNINNTTGAPFTLKYNTCGQFGITHTVTNNATGCSQSFATAPNVIQVNCPNASFSVLPILGCRPKVVTLNGLSSTPTGNVTYAWTIFHPAGTPTVYWSGAGVNPTATLSDTGCYDIRLIVTVIGSPTCKDTALQTQAVCLGDTVLMCFTAAPTTACSSTPICFTNCSAWPYTTGPPGSAVIPTPPIIWRWWFGGNPPPIQTTFTPTCVTFPDTGYQKIRLTMNWYGCRDTLEYDSLVYISPPNACVTKVVRCSAPLCITLFDTCSVGADSIMWQFYSGPLGGVVTAGGPLGVKIAATNTLDDSIRICFPIAGNVKMRLIVFNNNGCSDTFTTANIPIAQLAMNVSATPLSGCGPLTVTWTNNTLPMPGGGSQNNLTHLWTIIDNGTSATIATFNTRCPNANAVTGSYIFTTPGSYTVNYLVTAVNGCTGTQSWTINVYGLSPTFTPNTPVVGCAPLSVTFCSTTAASVNSTPVSYAWDFTGGSNCTGSTAVACTTYVFPTALINGQITLCVTDNHGCINSLTQTLITANHPTISFVAPDTTLCAGTTICFLDNTIANPPANYQWTFPGGSPLTSTSNLPCITYNTAGIYDVKLVVTDGTNCVDSVTYQNYIAVSDPQASYTVSDTFSSCPPLPVTFTSTSTGIMGGSNYHYFFGVGFGGGQYNGPLPNSGHIYSVAGTFVTSLIVTDTFGCSDTAGPINIVVSGPTATPFVSDTIGCPGVNITFNLVPTTSLSFLWVLGDVPAFTAGPTITHTYTLPGEYTPVVYLTDSFCTYAYPLGNIHIDHPTAQFTLSPQYLCGNGTVNFVDQSYPINPALALSQINSWTWDFDYPNGAAGVGQNPSYFYATNGTYIVQLIATSAYGCSDTAYDTVFVSPAPTAIINPVAGVYYPNQVVCFTDASISGTPIIDWHWTFGDPCTTNDSLHQATSNTPPACWSYCSCGPKTITLIVIAANGCSDTTTYSIIITCPPNATASVSDSSICLGDSVQLQSTANFSYHWYPNIFFAGTSISNDTLQNPWIYPTAAGTYYDTLIVGDGTGGFDTAYTHYVVNPLPVVNAGNDTSICPGTSAVLHGSPNGLTSYLWTPNSFMPNNTLQNPTTTPTGTIAYNLMGVDGNGCINNDSVIITLFPPAVAVAGIGDTICHGDTTSLSASGGVNYSWTYTPNAVPAEGIGFTTSTPVIWPAVSTTYTVQVTDANTCTDTNTVFVLVHQLPTPYITGPTNGLICVGFSDTLFANGAVSYNWLSPTGCPIPSPTGLYNVLSPMVADTCIYQIIGTDGNGCSDTSLNFNIIFQVPPILTCQNDTAICKGDTMTMNPTANQNNLIYTWSPILGLSDAHIRNPKCSPMSTTTYQLVAANTCGSDTCYIVITVNALPTVELGADIVSSVGATVQLTATPSTIGTYLWTPPDGLSCTTCANPTFEANNDATYYILFTDANHCMAHDSIHIHTFCNDDIMFVPNAFSPGKKDGINDVYEIVSVGIKQLNYFRIYDRWGNKVFETTDIHFKWDGSFKNKPLASDVYVYLLEAECSNGQMISTQGNITILR